MQHKRTIDFVRFFMHHEAKMNIYQDLKFDSLVPVQTFVNRKPKVIPVKKVNSQCDIVMMKPLNIISDTGYQSADPEAKQKTYDSLELDESRETLAMLRVGDLYSFEQQEIDEFIGCEDGPPPILDDIHAIDNLEDMEIDINTDSLLSGLNQSQILD